MIYHIFKLSGCVQREKLCRAPDARLDVDLTECNTRDGHLIPISQCHAKCAVSFSGNIKVECIEDGGQFQISGCEPNTCTLPATGLAGYATSGCQGKVESSKCHLQCAPGYTKGNREIYAICKQNDGTFVVEGCEENKCKIDSAVFNSENGYDLGWCNQGAGELSASMCLMKCISPGYTGYPRVECLLSVKMFSLVAGNKGCLKNTTMLPAPVPNPETQ